MLDIRKLSVNSIKSFIVETMNDLLLTSISDRGLSVEELEKKSLRKEKLNSAQKNCGIGDLSAKEFLKGFISDILIKTYGIDETNIDYVMNFSNTRNLSIQDQFEILLYHYKTQYSYDALEQLILRHSLDDLQEIDGEIMYVITSEQIEEIFQIEQISLSFEGKLNVITQRVYQEYKGLGVIDEIRDMNIEGVSGGVSGIPETYIMKNEDLALDNINTLPRAYNSVWIMHKGLSIQLGFLGFGSSMELERVSSLIYKFDDPGELSKAQGFIKNTMADGSRVTVFRPPFAESWMFWVRKDNVKNYELQELVKGNNSEVIIELLIFLMKGSMATAITGMQFTGKSSLLKALIKHIYAMFNLRIWEEFPDIHLRRILAKRNIATIYKTSDISGDIGLDQLKKTDGSVTIIGEVAEDPVAAYLLKVAQVTRFILFTHHAKTLNALVRSLRTSAVNTRLFINESIAQQQVISMLDFDTHLDMSVEGKLRFIERVTECVSNDEGDSCKGVNIIEYNHETDTYEIKNPISDERLAIMSKNMIAKDRKKFKEFVKLHFNKEISYA